MVKLSILFCSLFFLTLSFAQTKQQTAKNANFPTCEEVLSHVIAKMSRASASGISFDLAKKKEGYFLVVSKYENNTNTIVDNLPVWTLKTGAFVELNMKDYLGEPANENTVSAQFGRAWGDLHNYDFYKYYGYPEASIDLIKDLGKKKDPNLHEYELLARAHSNLAQRYFHPNIGGTPPAFAKDFTSSNYQKIAQERLDKASEHIEKSMMFWNHIEAVNPNYVPHIITNLHLKIANEQMHFWSLYMSVRESESARKILEEVDYADIDLAVAKRMLDNCEQNSFLLANGDNDTYPLWYVQEKLGYRTDVQLLNTSLLQTDWYLTMCKTRGNYTTNFTTNDYTVFNAFVVVSYDEGKTSIESIIQQTIPSLEGKMPEVGYLMVPKSISIDLGKEEASILETDTYLYMWQLALFDILISNPERAVHSTRGGVIWKSIGLTDQVAPRGSMNELVRGGQYVTNVERVAHIQANKQLSNMDLSQITDSYLSQFEFKNLVTNIGESHYLFNDEYEALGNQIIEGVNLDLLAKVDDPSIVNATVILVDALNPEKGVLLRDAYLEKAEEIVESLDLSGTNFLSKLAAIDNIYFIYSGKPLFGRGTMDTYRETSKQAALMKKLKARLEAIQQNLTSEERMRTLGYVDYVLSKMDDF